MRTAAILLTCRNPARSSAVSGTTRDTALDFFGEMPIEFPTHSPIVGLEFRVRDSLRQIGRRGKELVDLKPSNETILHGAGRRFVAGGHDGERGACPVRQQIGKREAASARVRIELFLEQTGGVAHSLVREYGDGGTHAEVLGPIGSPAKRDATQGPSDASIPAIGTDRPEEFLHAWMPQKHAESENGRPVLRNRVVPDG